MFSHFKSDLQITSAGDYVPYSHMVYFCYIRIKKLKWFYLLKHGPQKKLMHKIGILKTKQLQRINFPFDRF